MCDLDSNPLQRIGIVRSPLKDRKSAPNQGSEGAPDAWIELTPSVLEGLEGIVAGDELIIITWLHESRRDVLKTHPRGDERFHLPASSQHARRIDRIPSDCTESRSSRSLVAS
jgi:tRNA (Thr-GGU) A37 N-methylase